MRVSLSGLYYPFKKKASLSVQGDLVIRIHRKALLSGQFKMYGYILVQVEDHRGGKVSLSRYPSVVCICVSKQTSDSMTKVRCIDFF